jgi:hypothetical protein
LWVRADGIIAQFLLDKTLRIADWAIWMLPFVTTTDMTRNDAAMYAVVSHESIIQEAPSRRGCWQHTPPHRHTTIREPLKELWTTWAEFEYAAEPQKDNLLLPIKLSLLPIKYLLLDWL